MTTVVNRAAFKAYDGAISLLVAVGLAPFDRLQVRCGVTDRLELDERLGRWRPPPRVAPARWLVHAVSAGEVAAAGALISSVAAALPQIGFVVTTGNLAGRAAAERLARHCPSVESVSYLPWDRRSTMRRWLAGVRPDVVVLVEAEIWPNLLRECKAAAVPVCIVNGRIARGDVVRYRLARPFFAGLLDGVGWVGVPTERDRQAYIAIGAVPQRVEVMGNLKIDAPLSKNGVPESWIRQLEQATGPLIVAGSTHRGEERLLLDAFRGLRVNHPAARLIIAPRHADRMANRRTRSEGLDVLRWSDGPGMRWDVLAVDCHGVLPSLYRWADVAFIGGSLVRKGGHNPLEAAAAGAAIVIGPHHEHFRELVGELSGARALHVLHSTKVKALQEILEDLLADPTRRADMGRRAKLYVDGHRGVADRYRRILAERVSPGSSSDRASRGTGRGTPASRPPLPDSSSR